MITPTNFAELVNVFLDILAAVVPLIFSVTLLVIIWKIFRLWIFSPADADKIAEGKQVALIGVIALVIMSGIWGILAILRSGLFGV